MLDEEIKEFFKISLSMIGTRFIGLVTGLFSMLMLSSSSFEASVSCGLISSLLGFYMASSQALLSPVGIEYAISIAKKESRKTEELFLNGLLIFLLLFMLWLGLIFLIPYIGNVFAIDKNIMAYVKKYFLNITPGIACSLLYLLCSQILYAQNKQLKDTFFTLIGCLVFSVCFFFIQIKNKDIYTSITCSTNISSAVLLSLCLYYYGSAKKLNINRIQKYISLSLFISLIKSGLTIFTQVSVELAAFTVMTLLLGALGSNVLIAQRELTQISILFVLSAAAMGQAASIMVAKKKTQFNQEEMRRFVKKVLFVISLVYSLSLILLIIKIFPRFSMISRELITKKILLIFSLTIFLDALRHISSGILRGLGHYKLPTLAGLFGLWGICMPSLLLLSHFNSLTFELSRILLLIGILTACLVQLESRLVFTTQAAPPSGELSPSD